MQITITNLKRVVDFEKDDGSCKVEIRDMKIDDYKFLARELRDAIKKRRFLCDIKIEV